MSEYHDKGTRQCTDSDISLPGAIQNSEVEGSVQYLGLCNSSKTEETKYIKKEKKQPSVENKNNGTLSICNKDCGEENRDELGENPKVFTREKQASGKKIEFYKKS